MQHHSAVRADGQLHGRAKLLGTEIAYYDRSHVVATSFTRGATPEEDTAKARVLSDLLNPPAEIDPETAVPVLVDQVEGAANSEGLVP